MIILVRHGEATHHTQRLTGGWTDSQLTDKGRAQIKAAAVKLAKDFAGRNCKLRILASDLQRASASAQIIAEELGFKGEIEHCRFLREKNNGIAAGMTEEEAKKLAAAQRELAEEGYSLLIWDAYRPVSAQYRLWEVCPNPVYVADPTKGFSKHSRGNTVDISLVSTNGDPVEMPSGFDDFTSRADRDYSDVSQTAGENARYLEAVMTAAGFVGYSGEWWHYSDSTAYPVVR